MITLTAAKFVTKKVNSTFHLFIGAKSVFSIEIFALQFRQNLQSYKLFDKLRFVKLLMAPASKLAIVGWGTTTILPSRDPPRINTDLPIL